MGSSFSPCLATNSSNASCGAGRGSIGFGRIEPLALKVDIRRV